MRVLLAAGIGLESPCISAEGFCALSQAVQQQEMSTLMQTLARGLGPAQAQLGGGVVATVDAVPGHASDD
jgi:hypothetical protein